MKSYIDFLSFPEESEDEKLKEIRKEVNKHDKTYGLNLKKPHKVDYKIEYILLRDSFINDLQENINALNTQFIKSSVNNKHSGLFVQERNKDKKITDIDIVTKGLKRVFMFDDVFRERFLIILYTEMIKYVDDIVDLEFKRIGKSVVKDEQKYMILEKFVHTIQDFHNAYIHMNMSMPIVMKLNSLLTFRKGKHRDKVCQLLIDHTDIIKMSKTLFGFSLDDDILINDITKMAYIAVTEQSNIENTSPTMVDITLKDEVALRKVMINLGEDILIYKNKKKCRNPFLYDAFLMACPSMPCSHPDINSNTTIKVAVRAMYYLAFLANDITIYHLIEKMV